MIDDRLGSKLEVTIGVGHVCSNPANSTGQRNTF
jgi:hypothetical protein